MGFGVEDHFVEVEYSRWGEKQVEVFERFGKKKTLHRIRLLFGDDALERSVTSFGPTVLHEIAPELFTHPKVLWIFRVVIKVVGRLYDPGRSG